MAKTKIVKGTWQHYKGDFYEVLGVAQDPQREGDFVIYQALGITEDLTGEQDKHVLRTGNKGALSICAVDRFTELVDGGPYSRGEKVARFRLICRLPPDD